MIEINYWLRRRFMQYQQFLAMIQAAQAGKTFIFHHPDMVAVDRKTWNHIQDKLRPKAPRMTIYLDEYADVTSEQEKRLNDWVQKAFRKGDRRD